MRDDADRAKSLLSGAIIRTQQDYEARLRNAPKDAIAREVYWRRMVLTLSARLQLRTIPKALQAATNELQFVDTVRRYGTARRPWVATSIDKA